MKKLKLSLFVKVLIAIALGSLLGLVVPEVVVRIFKTFNVLFAQLLKFIVPLLVLGLAISGGMSFFGFTAGYLLERNYYIVGVFYTHIFLLAAVFVLILAFEIYNKSHANSEYRSEEQICKIETWQDILKGRSEIGKTSHQFIEKVRCFRHTIRICHLVSEVSKEQIGEHFQKQLCAACFNKLLRYQCQCLINWITLN